MARQAELKFNPNGQIVVSFKSDNLNVDADASMSGLEIDVKSTWYNIEVDFDISINKLACELSGKDNNTGSEEYIKVNGQLEGKKVDIKITSSISGFESIKTKFLRIRDMSPFCSKFFKTVLCEDVNILHHMFSHVTLV